MIIVHAFIEVKEGMMQEYMKSAEKLVEGTRKEPGNHFYTLYQDTENPQKLVVVEEWESKAALDLHVTLPHFVEHVETVKDMLAVPTVVKVYEAKAL